MTKPPDLKSGGFFCVRDVRDGFHALRLNHRQHRISCLAVQQAHATDSGV